MMPGSSRRHASTLSLARPVADRPELPASACWSRQQPREARLRHWLASRLGADLGQICKESPGRTLQHGCDVRGKCKVQRPSAIRFYLSIRFWLLARARDSVPLGLAPIKSNPAFVHVKLLVRSRLGVDDATTASCS